ncbi:MAG: hypothetical protein GF317_12760 [Candidatus Lokiarchaeota archaeon]|nr:hypothetical protein [Candidatus Lokiarchaeota archaeon]MBD3200512.1 hypothetical protein [Candidatus Lokiarchaeota archaeon]
MKCKKYVIIHTDNVNDNELVDDFEGKHSRHTVVTLDLREINREFQDVTPRKNVPSLET